MFVETLDKCFENVCELDLIFHVDKVSDNIVLCVGLYSNGYSYITILTHHYHNYYDNLDGYMCC